MTFVAHEPERHVGQVVANGQCVRFVQEAAGAPLTASWRKGARVRGNAIPAGTVIATFHPITKRYENSTTGRSHAAILLAETAGGLRVLDQWVGQPVHERIIRFRNGLGSKSNDGDQFYVVVT